MKPFLRCLPYQFFEMCALCSDIQSFDKLLRSISCYAKLKYKKGTLAHFFPRKEFPSEQTLHQRHQFIESRTDHVQSLCIYITKVTIVFCVEDLFMRYPCNSVAYHIIVQV